MAGVTDQADGQMGRSPRRAEAEALSLGLPALLAEAEHLAATLILGEHGRRRAGAGNEFWQYRPATAGDGVRSIDWRRSARSDQPYVREREWQAAQSVSLWLDEAQSMGFSGSIARPAKADRVRLLGLALAILLLRGGERVGLLPDLPPRSGRNQIAGLVAALGRTASADYGVPDVAALAPRSRAVFLSDFLGDMAPVERALAMAADRGVRGVLMQVLDPVEELFPYAGRTIFESMSGALSHETRKAGDLRRKYLDRLAERKAHLADLARAAGWHFGGHHTGDSAQSTLLWLYRAMEHPR
ncbi:DUF58 domain-containing protein [Plastorhodobacter daqingensis]|uniref:DUF58 domain-containing protein n=1 Tax=Plastorhodobacter daqingensis TaxID=1387281 RepID=A0ABW2UEL4_9RHOB